MKNAMAWAKENWMIVVLTAVAIIVLPVLWVLSSMMNASLREAHQKKVDAALKPFVQPSVTYALLTPEGTRIEELSVPPTTQTTAWYSKQWTALKAEMDKVGGAAEAFNKAKHAPLVEDLFPKPSALEDVFKRRKIAEQFIHDHATEGPLLSEIGAGGPTSVEQLAEMLKEFDKNKREQYRNERGTEPDQAVLKQWQEEMLQLRLGQYQLRSRQIALYGEQSAFTVIPSVPREPTLAQCWDLQEQYWIHQDILSAIKLANSGSLDGPTVTGSGVEDSVVKRLLRVQADGATYAGAAEPAGNARPAEPGLDEPLPPPPPPDPAAPAGGAPAGPQDFTQNFTGRAGGTATGNFYDVRKVTVQVIADADRLPAFFDALAATNFMTIVDVDMGSVDTAGDLRTGYYYGTARVVEATIVLETVWLRSWRVSLMPASVRTSLQVPEPPPADPANPAAPAPAGG